MNSQQAQLSIDQLVARLEDEKLIDNVATEFINVQIDDIEQMIRKCLETCCLRLRGDRAYILCIDVDMNITHLYDWHRPEFSVPQPEHGKSLDEFTYIEKMFLLNGMAVINSVSDLPHDAFAERDIFAKLGINSALLFPLIIASKIIGMIGIDMISGERYWTHNEIAFVNRISKIFANALDRRNSSIALKQSESRYRSLVENIQIGITLVDSQFRIVMTNPAMARLFGKLPGQMQGKHCFQEHEKQAEICSHCPGKIAMRTGQPAQAQARGIRDDGSSFIARIQAFPVHDEMGNISGFIELVEDISQTKAIADELARSQQMLQLVIDNFPGVVFWKDTNSVYLGCNKAFALGAGLRSVGEIVGKTDFDLAWRESEAQKYRQDDREVLNSANPKLGIVETQTQAGGRLVWFETNKVPLMDQFGKVVGVLGTSNDITDRKIAEDRLKSTLAASPAGIGISSNRIIQMVNERLCKLLEYTQGELIGQSTRIFYPTHRESERVDVELYSQVEKTGLGITKSQLRSKSGKIIDMLISAAPIDPKDPRTITWTILDISDLKMLQREREQLIRSLAAKNEELESIIYVSSHDLRSPLVNISGFGEELTAACRRLDQLLGDINTPDQIKEQLRELVKIDIPTDIEFISAGTSKIAMILDALLTVSRLGTVPIRPEKLDMNQLFAEIKKSLTFQLSSSGAKLQIADLPPCMSDHVQVMQVFTNLVDNAIKYLDPSRPGRVTVTGKSQDGKVIYCVEDNGIGIASQYHKKIFEMFHKLEPDRAPGQGLGLTIIKRILALIGGDIWLESTLGKGSSFYVSLPAAHENRQNSHP